MSNFITDCLNGDALLSEIDDYIERWHEEPSTEELHDYLGMTIQEYSLFVDDEAYLGLIVSARKDGVDLSIVMKRQYTMAARSEDASKAGKLKKWLEREGLWD